MHMTITDDFSALGLSEQMLTAVRTKGFETPTAIQKLTIPHLLTKTNDIIAQSQTGTGKTAAYGRPILQSLEPARGPVQAIILVPTRELALQAAEELLSYNREKRLSITAIYGGADIFLMPSLAEPCGLSQMIAMRYGTVPVVRETGGLRDTVIPHGVFGDTGFTFANINAHDMVWVLGEAVGLYYNNKDGEDGWRVLQRNGMTRDFSWNNPAREYEDVYYQVTGIPRPTEPSPEEAPVPAAETPVQAEPEAAPVEEPAPKAEKKPAAKKAAPKAAKKPAAKKAAPKAEKAEKKPAAKKAAAKAKEETPAPVKEAPKAEEKTAAPVKEAPKAEVKAAAPVKEAPKAKEDAPAPAKEVSAAKTEAKK